MKKKKKSIELQTSGKPTENIWISNSVFTFPLHSEGGAGKWTVNRFVCNFLYKNIHQVVYVIDIVTYTCACIHIKYVSAHVLMYHTHSAWFWEAETMWKCLISVNLMWWHSSVAGAAIVGTRTVATWHKGSLGSLPQQLFSYFLVHDVQEQQVGGEV